MKLPAKLEKEITIIKNNFLSHNFEICISRAKKNLKKLPNNSYLINIIGLSLNALGKYKEAEEIFARYIKFDPSNLVIKNSYSTTLKNLNKIDEAEKILENIVNEKPEYIHALNNLANIKKSIKKYESAIELYRKILNINNSIPLVHYNLSLCYLHFKEKESAKKHALIASELDPKFILADQIINTLTNYKKVEGHLNLLKQKIENLPLNEDSNSLLHFMVGKAYEDQENYKISYNYYKKANNIKRNTLTYNIKLEIDNFEKTKKIFKSNTITDQIQFQDNTKNLIFICGMPRSGTTLIEQILSTHTKVDSVQETGFFARIMRDNNLLDNNVLIKNYKKFNQLFHDEVIELINNFKINKPFVIDKSLFNFKYIGFIKIFFPNSKIFITRRNFDDNFFSIYKNTFQSNMMNWAYSEEEIKLYFKLFNDYLKFWYELFPKSFEVINYEDVVKDLETETRKILKICNLEWEKDCLKYYEKNKSPISTVSSHQASKPIYSTSIGKFKYFKEFF